MNGVIVGGWEYVWAAYALTGAGFIVYFVSLVVRNFASLKSRARRTRPHA